MARALIAGLISLALAGGIGSRIAAPRDPSGGARELPYFPSGRMLEVLSLGQRSLCADLAWLQAIQYYGRHHLSDRSYPLAGHLFRVTTALDPRFVSPYIFGALVLGEEAGDPAQADRLLYDGMRANPGDWMLGFQRGFLQYLHGDPAVGAVEMQQASRMPGAPAYTARLAAHACARVGKRELAIRLWKEIATSGDPAMRALAEDRLRELAREDGKGDAR